jgi:hypothetical protein
VQFPNERGAPLQPGLFGMKEFVSPHRGAVAKDAGFGQIEMFQQPALYVLRFADVDPDLLVPDRIHARLVGRTGEDGIPIPWKGNRSERHQIPRNPVPAAIPFAVRTDPEV